MCTEHEIPAGILCCYGEKNDKPSFRYIAGKRIQYNEGVTEDLKIEIGKTALIILATC
jgi:hypothetical protein